MCQLHTSKFTNPRRHGIIVLVCVCVFVWGSFDNNLVITTFALCISPSQQSHLNYVCMHQGKTNSIVDSKQPFQ